MESTNIIEQYLKALEVGSYEEMMKLFTSDAIIHSPKLDRCTLSAYFTPVQLLIYLDVVRHKKRAIIFAELYL